MSAPGLIALPSGSAAAMLTRALRAIFGSSLIGAWATEDIALSGSDVTGCSGRVGPAMTAGINRNGASTIGGRKAMLPPSLIANNALVATLSAVKSLIAVAVGPAPYPVNGQQCLCFSTNFGITCTASTGGSLYVGSGVTTYVNGIASTAFTVGAIQVFQADHPTNAAGSVIWGGYNTVSVGSWQAPIGYAAALSATPSADNRATSTALLRSYYQF